MRVTILEAEFPYSKQQMNVGDYFLPGKVSSRRQLLRTHEASHSHVIEFRLMSTKFAHLTYIRI